MNIGRRRKRFGREREEGFHGAIHLHGYGEQSIVARAWRGRDAGGHFALDHENGAIENGVAGGEFEEDLRCDAVGQIANDDERLAGGCGGGGEVEVQDVLSKDCNAPGRELSLQMSGEAGIKLDGDNMRCAGGECSSDGAGAGADFDDSAAGEIAE